jgi:hypothetical protein
MKAISYCINPEKVVLDIGKKIVTKTNDVECSTAGDGAQNKHMLISSV